MPEHLGPGHGSGPEMDQVGDAVSSLSAHFYLSLTTYKRDGRGVATVVWFIVREGRIYFRTPGNTGKVKRLRRSSNVSFFACDREGRRVGPTVLGTARLFERRSGRELVP